MAVLPQALITDVTSGTPVAIVAKTWARGVAISEDPTGAAAGLAVTFPNGKTVDYSPAQQPAIIGAVPPTNVGPFVGQPASSVGGGGNSATQYCTIESLGATTIVKVVEYN